MLNEVYRDRVPRSFGDRKLLKQTIWAMVRSLGVGTGHARIDIGLDKTAETWPDVFMLNELQGVILLKVTR